MDGIVDRHREQIAALCERAGVRRLDAFGSVLRGDFDAQRSHVDLLVEFDEAAPAQYAQAYFALKESLEALLGRPVDLVTRAGLANPYLRQRIDAERRVLYVR